eukprot:UN20820
MCTEQGYTVTNKCEYEDTLYIFEEGRECTSKLSELLFSSVQAGKNACEQLEACVAVYDSGCDNNSVGLCDSTSTMQTT